MKFKDRVFNLVCKIPSGCVTTYKEIAHKLGIRGYRAIGLALKQNENSFIDGGLVPCHRVVKSNGLIGGFFGEVSGVKIDFKRSLLEKEGIEFDGDKIINFKEKLYCFD